MGKKIKRKLRGKEKKKYRFYTNLFFVFGVVFLGTLIGVILFNYADFSFIEKHFSEEVSIHINDECSFIMGNLIHQIRDETDCSLQCKNRCDLINKEQTRSEFALSLDGCNSCECYCK